MPKTGKKWEMEGINGGYVPGWLLGWPEGYRYRIHTQCLLFLTLLLCFYLLLNVLSLMNLNFGDIAWILSIHLANTKLVCSNLLWE